MRIWSIHPQYLDPKGLVAAWREGLLAKKVLQGRTKGYRNHPQLIRFRAHKYPLRAINAYLYELYKESVKRGYNFDKRKVSFTKTQKIPVTSGQIKYEFEWLKTKLKQRDRKKYKELIPVKRILINPALNRVSGPIESWEKQ